MHRFFVPPAWLQAATPGSRVILHDPVAYQLRTVLRVRPGAQIIVLDNQGGEYTVTLAVIGKQQVEGVIQHKRSASGEPTTQITLYPCLLKKDNFEWILQKCTEIGVTAFVPVLSQYTIVSSAEPLKSNKRQRWERIITEAAEQSRRGRLPVLHEPISFEHALRMAQESDLALIPWEKESVRHLRTVLTAFLPDIAQADSPHIALFIGPEGGFTDEEIALAQQQNVQPITLGPRILRAETAAVATAALMLYELEQVAFDNI